MAVFPGPGVIDVVSEDEELPPSPQPDPTRPAESIRATTTHPTTWSLSYAMHAILTDGTHAMVPCSSISWEEQSGELAARISASFPVAPLEDGRRLPDLITMGSYLTVLAAFGSDDYVEVARGVVEEVSPSDGSSATFNVVAYDPIKALLSNKINAYYPAGIPISDVVEGVLGGKGLLGQAGFNVPIGDLHDAMHTELPRAVTYHAQTLADILVDCVKIAQESMSGNDRLVIRTEKGVVSVTVPGKNATIYWLRQDPEHSNVSTIRERLSIAGLVTKLVVTGKADVLGDPGVIMTIDATDSNFGITRQDILSITQYETPEAISKKAQLYMNNAGSPRHDRVMEAPDIPFIRKYDQIRISAGTLDDYFSVEAIQHEEGERRMNISIGTLHAAPDIGTATPLEDINTAAIPDPSNTGGFAGGAAWSGEQISDAQLYALAKAAGFTGNDAIMAVAISLAENATSNPNARNTANQNGTVDLGLWQINSIHWSKYGGEGALVDPLNNAKAAYGIWKDAGGRWTPWSTYNVGAYSKYMTRAQAAAAGPAASVPTASKATSSGAQNQQALKAAMNQWVNVKYQLGGSTKAGVDCSGFTQGVFHTVGVNLPRTAQGQWNATERVQTPQFGDLVFFRGTYDAGTDITHVGIYVGNGEMVSAVEPTVKRESFQTQGWKSHFAGYGRVKVPDPNAGKTVPPP